MKSFPEKAAAFEDPGAQERVSWRRFNTPYQELSPLQSKTQAVLNQTLFRRGKANLRGAVIRNPLSWPLFDKLAEIATECLVGLSEHKREIRTGDLRNLA